jgi:hypothetical protein
MHGLPQLDFLAALAQPAVVVSWYAVGAAGAAWTLYDAMYVNRAMNRSLRWAWPIIVFFFSIAGLLLYRWTCRPPHIGELDDEAQQRVYRAYAGTTTKRVIGSAIHCVGGDGLGIITAMVVARTWNFSFWQEFWFEYAGGFAFGWFIFQYVAMRSMADSALKALWMAGRAEFFSMMTVMAGMGAVMAFVTPLVIGEQPDPTTFGFWGFAALGLLVGFIVTYPMNLVLVRIGWKHGTVH